MATNKIQDADIGFILGANSGVDPVQLPPGAYARGMNVVNRGGIVQCRPGYRCSFVAPEGRMQGSTLFKPKNGSTLIVFGVEGALYVSEAPFTSYRQIDGIEFSPDARQLFFKQVEQSVDFNPDGSLVLVDPKNLLIIQDGGYSNPVIYDGTDASHQRGDGTIPIGGPMEWVGDRLWVAQGSALIPSDLGNPTAFTEQLYIATVSKFVLPGPITALAKNPAVAFPQLLAFTQSTTTIFQAGVSDRAAWVSTPDFQKEIFPKIGCVSQRSVVAHYGFLWWFSNVGLTSIDVAAQTNVSSELPYRDSEMTDSKARLSSDLSGVACATFENYLLASVPHADLYNTHTWCLDNTAIQSGKQTVPAWNSFWTGTRPVEWMSGSVNGVDRCFYFSVDYDGLTRLWEAFIPDRLDDGCPITWWFETRGLFGGIPFKNKEFRYADVFLSELAGRVDIGVFWAGSHRGKYKKILTKQINASRGVFRSGENITMTKKLFALKKQSRPLRTQDGRALISRETLQSCAVESPNKEFRDEAFQLLVVGSGPAAVRGFIAYMEPPTNDDDAGRVEVDETEENFVRFDGAAAESHDFQDALAQLEEDIPLFTSTRSESLTQDGYTAIGFGEASSVISQANADYLASVIARKKAAEELQDTVPRIVSLGADANTR